MSQWQRNLRGDNVNEFLMKCSEDFLNSLSSVFQDSLILKFHGECEDEKSAVYCVRSGTHFTFLSSAGRWDTKLFTVGLARVVEGLGLVDTFYKPTKDWATENVHRNCPFYRQADSLRLNEDLGHGLDRAAYGSYNLGCVWRIVRFLESHGLPLSGGIHVHVGCGVGKTFLRMAALCHTDVVSVGVERCPEIYNQLVANWKSLLPLYQAAGKQFRTFCACMNGEDLDLQGANSMARFCGHPHADSNEIEQWRSIARRFFMLPSASCAWDTRLSPQAFETLELSDDVKKQWTIYSMRGEEGNNSYQVFVAIKKLQFREMTTNKPVGKLAEFVYQAI
jgi:hypothetical protein